MPKHLVVILGVLAVVIFGVLGFLLWQNNRDQSATEKRLADLQNQMTAATRSGQPTVGQPTVPVFPIIATAGATQNLSVLQKQRDMRTIMEEGWKLINERKPKAAEQAAALFREGLEKVDGKNAQFYNGLGRALLIAGEPRAALAAWQKGLELDASISDMQSGIGWAYWNLKDFYHAKQAWERTLSTNPKSLDAWTALVWIYLALGDTDQSKTGFQVLYQSDRQNNNWILGLQMAQAKNTDLAQIAKFFPLPPLAAFAAPPATATMSAPARQP